eukprot:scaffold910_cov115-Isochrysis_galbana.AAC.3
MPVSGSGWGTGGAAASVRHSSGKGSAGARREDGVKAARCEGGVDELWTRCGRGVKAHRLVELIVGEAHKQLQPHRVPSPDQGLRLLRARNKVVLGPPRGIVVPTAQSDPGVAACGVACIATDASGVSLSV